MKSRYPWVAVWADTARVGAIAVDSYSGATQKILRHNLQCFARMARDEMRRGPDICWPSAAPRQDATIDDGEMAGA